MNSTLAINWEQLSLIVGDDSTPADEEMTELYRLFVDDAGRRLRILNAPTATFDRTAVAKEAHKIRGAASSFGFDQVANLLRIVETEIAGLNQERVEEMLREALHLFEQSIREVSDRFPALASA